MRRQVQLVIGLESPRAARRMPAEWRLQSLCRELGHLKSEIKRLKSIIAFKDRTLLYEVRFLEEVIRDGKPQTMLALRRRISRLKGALDREQGGLPDQTEIATGGIADQVPEALVKGS